MDLKGAAIRSFYNVTDDVHTPVDPSEWPKVVRIPLYQRPYRWGEPQISKLIRDYEAEPGNSYFSGSIVTVNNVDKNVHELIDGQQRYTTVYLVNFVVFLLARVLIREAIQRNKVMDMKSLAEGLKKSALYLFKHDTRASQTSNPEPSSTVKVNQIADSITLFSSEMYRVFSKGSVTEDETCNILQELSKVSALPVKSIQTETSYINDCKDLFERFLSNKSLRLEYDRPIFNYRLKKALTCLTITLSNQEHIKLLVNEEEISKDESLQVYVDAVRTIFNELSDKNDETDPFLRAINVLEKTSEFLDGIKLCVVQTGNPRDAFTLFEVLNDRSLALSELDLIKNQFYRTYVLSNSTVSDSNLDRTLQSIDDLWVQGIFDGEGANKSDLISYLAIVFLSGSPTAIHKNQESIRDALGDYLRHKEDVYPEADLVRDINVFSYCKSFIKQAGLKFNGSEGEALCDVYDPNKPLVYQVASYLLACNQESVLAGLVCYIIKLITSNADSTLSSDQFESELNRIAADETSQVHKQAKYLWQYSILSKDSSKPRNKSTELITRNHISAGSYDPYLQAASASEYTEFETWANGWSYNDTGSGKFKIRYLFAKLIRLSSSNNQLTRTPFSVTISRDKVKKLHLDHMEAKSPNPSHLQDYFQHADRNYYVHGLGNMMPLPGPQNMNKGNRPFHPAALNYIRDAGFPTSHFLYQLSRRLYNQHNLNNVPTEGYFKERKKEIIELFKQAIAL